MVRRRRFLATGTTALLGALAGCSTAVGAVAPPDVPESKPDDGGWKQVDESQSTSNSFRRPTRARFSTSSRL